MAKTINHIEFDDTISLTECTDGFWLYDTTRGMNLSMRAKTKDDAFFEALKYYQNRLIEVESDYKIMKDKVSVFVNQFSDMVDCNCDVRY